MSIEFYSLGSLGYADPFLIKRVRWSPSDGGHGEPVCHAVLADGRVGRFLDFDEISGWLACLANDVKEHGLDVVAAMSPMEAATIERIVGVPVPR